MGRSFEDWERQRALAVLARSTFIESLETVDEIDPAGWPHVERAMRRVEHAMDPVRSALDQLIGSCTVDWGV